MLEKTRIREVIRNVNQYLRNTYRKGETVAPEHTAALVACALFAEKHIVPNLTSPLQIQSAKDEKMWFLRMGLTGHLSKAFQGFDNVVYTLDRNTLEKVYREIEQSPNTEEMQIASALLQRAKEEIEAYKLQHPSRPAAQSFDLGLGGLGDLISIDFAEVERNKPAAPVRNTRLEDDALLEILELVGKHRKRLFSNKKYREYLLGAPIYSRSKERKVWLGKEATKGKTQKRTFFDKSSETFYFKDEDTATKILRQAYYEMPDKALYIGDVIQYANDSRYNERDKNRVYAVFVGMTPSNHNGRIQANELTESELGKFLFVKFDVNEEYKGKYENALADALALGERMFLLFERQRSLYLKDPYLGLLAPLPDNAAFLSDNDPDYMIAAVALDPTYKYAVARDKAKASGEVEAQRTENPKRKLGYWTETKFPYLPLAHIEALEPLARALGVSEVARGAVPSSRGDRGFLVALRDADGIPSNLDEIARQDGKSEDYWINKREDFNTRHYAQIRKNKRPLWFTWKGKVIPTRQHLALAMWAYSPEHKKLMRWIERNEHFLRSL